eukprot:505491-Pelagomonas_calceolata.AAC.4
MLEHVFALFCPAKTNATLCKPRKSIRYESWAQGHNSALIPTAMHSPDFLPWQLWGLQEVEQALVSLAAAALCTKHAFSHGFWGAAARTPTQWTTSMLIHTLGRANTCSPLARLSSELEAATKPANLHGSTPLSNPQSDKSDKTDKEERTDNDGKDGTDKDEGSDKPDQDGTDNNSKDGTDDCLDGTKKEGTDGCGESSDEESAPPPPPPAADEGNGEEAERIEAQSNRALLSYHGEGGNGNGNGNESANRDDNGNVENRFRTRRCVLRQPGVRGVLPYRPVAMALLFSCTLQTGEEQLAEQQRKCKSYCLTR